ncbi:MAG: ABC transporter substrate-binding protein [Deltaproteobacteria bacterium]|nr:ABC transporter substrate-binding protein [Deltaproteobacteria bacterium]
MRKISATIIFALAMAPLPVNAQKVRMSYAGTSGYNVPFWVGHEGGFFRKHGLASELLLISGGSTSIQALLANELQFVNAGATPAIQAITQGAPVVIIATYYNLMPYSVIVGKEIRSVSDLKGKRLAITRLGGITEFAARLAFDKLGLDQKDMVLIQSGPDAQRIAAVQSGAVAAAIVAPPGLFAATSLGLRIIADLGELGVKYPMGVMITSRPYMAQNRSAVKKFMMGLIEGLDRYLRDRDFSIGVMRTYTRIHNPEILSKSHDYFVKNTDLVPFTDPVAVKNALSTDKTGGRRLEDFYDNSLIQELVNEGFVEKGAKKLR